MLLFQASLLDSLSNFTEILYCKGCLKDWRCAGVAEWGMFMSSYSHENHGMAAIHWKNNKFPSVSQEAPQESYQHYADPHISVSLGSTSRPYNLHFNIVQYQKTQMLRNKGQTRSAHSWSATSWHTPIRCHLHAHSYTKSARQCVNLLSLKLVCIWAGAKITLQKPFHRM